MRLTRIFQGDYMRDVMFGAQLKRIRSEVFAATQLAFGEIAGVSQATVSKWEKDKLSPEISQMSKIRAEAVRRGLEWNDDWFFQAPISKSKAA